MILSPLQESALRSITEWFDSGRQEYYLAGFAGSGKTTLVQFALRELEAHHGLASTAIGAYTGKAAHVLRKKGNLTAATLHSLAYEVIPGSSPVAFRLAWESALRYADVLVIDEASMVPSDMADDLRRLCRRLLVIGDPGQLPPVRGLGSLTSREPDFFLHEIHRQALDHPILRLATAAREGRPISAADSTVGAVVEPARSWEQLSQEPGSAIVVGRHRTRFSITRHFRELKRLTGVLPVAGEPLICRQNNHELGIYNGQEATADWVVPHDDPGYLRMKVRTEDGVSHEVTVPELPFLEHYSGRSAEPRFRERGVERFDYSYALTCHSAQGSEWPAVTVVDDSDAFGTDANRWLYTALTRASERVKLLLRRRG